ncbi:MAG: hypothetical protein IPJ65_38345 [Archangiaceae bacterium]|nr:hypothetical protein [Archangiaceae bacterium]
MSKPFKTNEVPVAPFNLRTEGPMTLLAASAAVHGKNFRAATGSDPDKRATVDKDPCPHCGAQVEWVHTVQAGAKSVYVNRNDSLAVSKVHLSIGFDGSTMFAKMVWSSHATYRSNNWTRHKTETYSGRKLSKFGIMHT